LQEKQRQDERAAEERRQRGEHGRTLQDALADADTCAFCKHPQHQPDHPVSRIEWVAAALLVANDYNPNVQPPPEFRLLKVSLLEDGWTQPLVVHDRGDGSPLVIVDGEHRWRVAREDREVAARTGGLVPIVRLRGDRAHLMMATIRHNRARGEHGVKAMSAIVRELLVSGMSDEDVSFLLQMEPEEVDRLADAAGLPRRVVKDAGEAFANGWVPK